MNENPDLRALRELVAKGYINENQTARKLPRERFKSLAKSMIAANRGVGKILENHPEIGDSQSSNALKEWNEFYSTFGLAATLETAATGKAFYETGDSSVINPGRSSLIYVRERELNEEGLHICSVLFPPRLYSTTEGVPVSRQLAVYYARRMGFIDPLDPEAAKAIIGHLSGDTTAMVSNERPRIWMRMIGDLNINHPSDPYSMRIDTDTLLNPVDVMGDLDPYGKQYAARGITIYYHDPTLPQVDYW